MVRKAAPTKLLGRWRITSMTEWDDDFLDEESEAYIRFDADGGGAFHFGYVQAVMDCRLVERDGKPAVEWSWEGDDEMTPASGRGWAVLQDDGTLAGKILFFQGEESGFTAKRKG